MSQVWEGEAKEGRERSGMTTTNTEPQKGNDEMNNEQEWSGYPDPCDPANFWIDDDTGERVNAETGERTTHICPEAE